MKVILVCAYFLALTDCVLASGLLSCYNCVLIHPDHSCRNFPEPRDLKYLQLFLDQDMLQLPIQFCVGFSFNVTYTSVVMVKEEFSCLKLDFEVDFRNGTKHEGSWRTIFRKGRCSQIEKGFNAIIDEYAGYDVISSVNCHECRENLCNLGNMTKASIFLILLPLSLIYLMQFNERIDFKLKQKKWL